ncbi:uncharacterized protein BJ171DRAFT_494164 [Polychytrium aggregatum]|uniref:uncharacterized protein n=1 Tax=Polychytrium aggregatum TaxID=110093 RepID=UPI0022FF0FD3|nr:uncharacterized protein BJ171DRAFT_494164 [Polychytrium aggregatum]KAI9207286.1 hypothetical protein BJ171DRAFT_494164 [Polychytrium aggregatum]
MGKGLAPLPAWVGKKSMGSILDSVTEGPAKPNPNANTDVIGTARPSWADVFPNNEYETPSIRSSTGSTSSGPRRRMSDVGPVSNYRASLLQRQQLDIKEESSSALVPNHISTSNIDQVVRQVTMVPHHEFSFSNYHSTVALGPYSLQLVSFIATGEKDALAEGEIVVALACAGALTPDPTEPAASTDQIQHQASPDLGRSAISGPLPLVTLESPQAVIPASLPQPTSSILSAPLDMPPCSTNAASSADPQASGCTRPRLDPAQISLAFEFSIEYCEKQTYLAVAQYQEHIAPHSLRYRLEVDIKKAFLNNLYLKFKDSKVEATSHSFELCGKGTASIVLNDQGGQHQGILPFGYEVIKVFTPTSSITKLDQTQQT